MIKLEDLSEKRQQDLADTIRYNEPWMSDDLRVEHAIGALQGNTLDAWEKWGFGALKQKKWVYTNGVKWYNDHKSEVELYLFNRAVKPEEKEEIPEEVKPTKRELTAQKKEQEKVDKMLQKMLYGAGDQGWTVEWFNKIMNAYKENRLTITGMVDEVNIVLSTIGLTEDMLNDEERLILMMYCHPQRIIGR